MSDSRLVLCLAIAGCYGPSIHPGSPCSANAPCPVELMCSPTTQTCEYPGTSMDANANVDATSDGMVADAAPVCLGPLGWTVCFAPPTAPVSLGSNPILTDSSPLCQMPVPTGWTAAGQPPACIIIATEIDVTALVHVHGMRPLVLVASDTIDISAELDVSSHRSSVQPGAGADSSLCASFVATPTSDGYGGGGAGGSFMVAGANGGTGDAGGAKSGVAPSADSAAPAMLRGGCAGQNGGGPNPGTSGSSGGAVYLLAGSTITVSGAVNASGEGGTGGGSASGGSGGGAGGMIVLNAPTIAATGGTLIANGGGGASGGAAAAPGINGADPNVSLPFQPAPGGGNAGTSAGGSGFAGMNNPTAGSNNAAAVGGSGGGGGAGYIRANQQLVGAAISPAASIVP